MAAKSKGSHGSKSGKSETPSSKSGTGKKTDEAPKAAKSTAKHHKADAPADDTGELKLKVQLGEPLLEQTFTADNVGKFILGEITWGNLIGMTPEDAQGFAEYAYKQYVAGRYHDAKKVFEGLVLINPYNSYYHAMYGACLQVLDEREAAMDEYSTAIRLDESNLQALVNRAELHLRTANFQEALDDLNRVVALDPDTKDPATVRARALAAATSQTLMLLADMVAKHNKDK